MLRTAGRIVVVGALASVALVLRVRAEALAGVLVPSAREGGGHEQSLERRFGQR